MSSSANDTETFQHYQVAKRTDGTLWELGRGAMGITYKAFDTNLRCDVALKVINALHLDSDTARARFQREARAAAGLRHRNVATVYHLGNDDQSFFYAMEFVDGETVETLVKKRGPMAPTDALQVVVQVARALGAAARQNLVHRDIKPANIMVVHEDEDEDQYIVKVIDFGLARPALGGEGSAHITMGGFVGTPQYASPEQLEEKDLDARSDIYSLGVTLWFMLAGKPPFTGPLGSVFIQQLTKEPPWEQISGTPEPVRKLLAHMLQKDPAHRQQSPVELRREIEACLRALSSSQDATGVLTAANSGSQTADTAAADTVTASAASTDVADTDADTDVHVPPTVPPADVEIASFTARTAVLGVGSLLGGRYELARLVGEGNNGRVFQAFDVERNRAPVAVKVLHSDVLVTSAERRRFEGDLSKLLLAPHPNLLEVYGLEEAGDTNFLVSEWANGFTLVDLLRVRGQLPLRETMRLLAQTAAAADHARAQELLRIELGLHQILTHFPALSSGGDSEIGVKTALNHPLDQWPDFALKIDALGITREAGDSMTWAGDMTMMPSAPLLGRDTQTSIRGLIEGSDLFAIGLLTYELLDGAPPAVNQRGDGREARYVALSALNEPANAILRRALSPNPGFASNTEFFQALLKASGLNMTFPAIPAPTASTAPSAASETPETSTPSETLILDEPPVAKTAVPAADESASTLVLGEGESIIAPVSDPRQSASETTALRDRPLDSASSTGSSTVAPPEPPPVQRADAEESSSQTYDQGAGLEDGAQTVLLDSASFLTPSQVPEPPPLAKSPEAPLAEASSSQTLSPETPFAREPSPLDTAFPLGEPLIQAQEEVPAFPSPPAEELPKSIDFRVAKETPLAESAAPPLAEPPQAEISAESSAEEAAVSSFAPSQTPAASPVPVLPIEPARMDRADVSLDYPSAPPVPEVRPLEEATSIQDRQGPVQKEAEIEEAKPLAEKATVARTKAPLPPPPVRVSRPEPQIVPDFAQPEPEPQASGSKVLLMAGAVAVVLVIGGSIAFLGTNGKPRPTKPTVAVVRPTPALEQQQNAPKPMETALHSQPSTPEPKAPPNENPVLPVAVAEPKSEPSPSTVSNAEREAASNPPPPVAMPPPTVLEPIAASTPAPSPTPAANRSNNKDNEEDSNSGRASNTKHTADRQTHHESTPAPRTVARESRPPPAPPEKPPREAARKEPPQKFEKPAPKPVAKQEPKTEKPQSTPDPRSHGPGVGFMR